VGVAGGCLRAGVLAAAAHLEVVGVAPQRGVPLEALRAVVVGDGRHAAVLLDELMPLRNCSDAQEEVRLRYEMAAQLAVECGYV
jgi:hypothetical protein